MYDKTTSASYFKYGKSDVSKKVFESYKITQMIVENKTANYFVIYSGDVYVELIEGMAMLVILDTDYKLFAIHRNIRINKGQPFAILPMSSVALYNLYTPKKVSEKKIKLNSPYVFNPIDSAILVKEITALYYVVKSPKYKFAGERHHLFELTYVDHGSLETEVEDIKYELNEHDCMIYYPGQFHTQEITSSNSCSYITIIFECTGISSENMFNRVYHCSRELVSILEHLAKYTDSDYKYRDDLLITYLQLFLIKLHQLDVLKVTPKPTTLINQHFENTLLEEILFYIQNHLMEPLPIDQICNHFSVSRSSLQNLFRNNLNTSPKHYINEAKLSLSRVLIKKGEYTISEISNRLGFTSIHYFSRRFTTRYGVTPSEYAKKIYE